MSENGMPQPANARRHLEEVMTQQNLRPQIALAAAALVLGVALAPVSAFAQARNVNDGGQVSVPAGATLNSGSKPAATSTYYGRGADDGGTGPQPSAAQVSATQAKAAVPKKSKTAGAPAPVVIGRSVNDGGPVSQ
jgi:hypothetical protein